MSEIPSGISEEDLSHQNINESREQFDEEHNLRAEERNRYRTIWQKMFGLEKTTGMDTAMEEALKMDAAIEEELKEGRAETIDEALKNVDQMPNFQLKGEGRIQKEEYAGAKALQVGRAITNNEFHEAVSIWNKEHFRSGVDDETKQFMSEHIVTLIKNHTAELARSKDGTNFVSSIYWFGSHFKAEDLPQDEVKSPEITGAVRDHAVSWLKTFHHEGGVGKEWKKFSRLGLLNEEEIVQDPEVRQFAEQRAASYFRTFYYEPATFARIRDNFTRLGIGSTQEYNQLPQIQEFAKEKAISYFKTFSYDPNTYRRLWKDFDKLGILSLQQIKELPEIAERLNR